MPHSQKIPEVLESKSVSDWQILTDTGWVDILETHKTIPYEKWKIVTNSGKNLIGADLHRVFNNKNEPIYISELTTGDHIFTQDGLESVCKVEQSKETCNMFDLTLSDASNHRYYANGILSHNSTNQGTRSILFGNLIPGLRMATIVPRHEQLRTIAYKYSEIANTNIRSVFQLILKTAINNKLKQEDLPKQILIISDMEFDAGVSYVGNPIEESQAEFEKYGYQLPRLVFWNVCARTNTIPVTQNKLGVYLISGFSPNVLDIVFEGMGTPFESLKKILDKNYSEVPEIS